MAQQTIGVGTTANDGTGDQLRAAFIKANDNFDECYDASNLPLDTLTTTNGFDLLKVTIPAGQFTDDSVLELVHDSILANSGASNNVDLKLQITDGTDTITIPLSSLAASNLGADNRALDNGTSNLCQVRLVFSYDATNTQLGFSGVAMLIPRDNFDTGTQTGLTVLYYQTTPEPWAYFCGDHENTTANASIDFSVAVTFRLMLHTAGATTTPNAEFRNGAPPMNIARFIER